MRPSLGVIAAIIALTALLSGVQGASADGPAVESAEAKSLFPDGIKFSLTASSSTKGTQALLRYRLLPSKIDSTIRAECEGDARVTCEVTIGGSIGRAFYIVPFAEVSYYWEVTDAAGNTMTTDPRSTFYDDIRFRWRTVADGNLTLYYYTGDEAAARKALVAGREAIDKHSALLGTKVDFPVKIIDYANTRDLEEASTRGRRGGGNIIFAGQMVADDTVVMTLEAYDPNADLLDILRHELAHVVSGHAVRDGRMDSWINEGLSMYAQRIVERGYVVALRQAIREGRIYPLVRLNSASVLQNDPDVFYAQAHSMVAYLVDTHGGERLREFIVALNDDKKTDEAMQAVYGFDRDTFEDAWRESVGLKPLGSTGPSAQSQTEPLVAPERPQAAASSDGGESMPGTVVFLVVGLVVVLMSFGFLKTRRKKAPEASQPEAAAE